MQARADAAVIMTTIMSTQKISIQSIASSTSLWKNVNTCKATSSRREQISASPSCRGARDSSRTQRSFAQRLNATEQDKGGVSNSSNRGNTTSSRKAENVSKSQKGSNQKPQSLLSQIFGNQLPVMAFVSALTFAAYKGIVSGQDGPEKVLMAPSVMAVILLVSFFGWRTMAELRKR